MNNFNLESSESSSQSPLNEEQLFFSGSRYSFHINYGKTWFEIVAIYQQTGKRSNINTLSYVLSAFDIDPDSENAENPEWDGKVKQVAAWLQLAQSLFTDTLFLQSLEKALDKDRQEGEWEAG